MMRFADPQFLLLLFLLPVLSWLRGRRGQQPAFLYSSVRLVRSITGITRSQTGRVLAKLRWLALTMLVLALARPQWNDGEVKLQVSGIDIAIALDLSSSMKAEDFELDGKRVNRLAAAKDVLRQFIMNRPDDRIGLVAFAGRAYIAGPMTSDHEFLLQNLRRLTLDTTEDGTAIGSALTTGLNRLRSQESSSRIITLMTGGRNNAGSISPLTAAAAAQALGVKIYTIGLGTHTTAQVPQTNISGRTVYREIKVGIDEDTLRKIASKTGGNYYQADNSSELRSIHREIDKLEENETEAEYQQKYEELFPWFVLAGLVMFLLELILAHTVWRKLP